LQNLEILILSKLPDLRQGQIRVQLNAPPRGFPVEHKFRLRNLT